MYKPSETNTNNSTNNLPKPLGLKKVASALLLDPKQDLPAGAAPYEDFDFEPYFHEEQDEEELRKTWRVFTKVKDVLDNGRRLENASWRLWHRERSRSDLTKMDGAGESSDGELEGIDVEEFRRGVMGGGGGVGGKKGGLKRVGSGGGFGGVGGGSSGDLMGVGKRGHKRKKTVANLFEGVDVEKLKEETERIDERNRVERAERLFRLGKKHGLDQEVLDDLLGWVHHTILDLPEVECQYDFELMPRNMDKVKMFLDTTSVKPRRRVAVFGHSLERNGANNFLLYLVRELKDYLSFDIYSPKEGPMREEYKAMLMPVLILNMKSQSYPQDVRKVLGDYDYAIANTIMTTEVINASKQLNVPCLWVIHEAWPKDQMNYYAKEVFLMPHLDEDSIVQAFGNASKIVFPARVQRQCYEGLFREQRARVIYNGIPMTAINTYVAVQQRDKVRQDMGYGPDDILLVQMGTVCKRKAQLVTARAFARLSRELPTELAQKMRLLYVGARYIRQHEIDYIERIKACVEDAEVDDKVTILDVKKNVLPYYLAADIILCPSINEVLPLVICEAMAFERPVIATRIDGIPEAVDDGKEGLLIEPGSTEALSDAIQKLVVDPELRERMGQAGRNRVLSQFSFETMAKTYRDTIGEDLKGDQVVPVFA